ncbi:gamma-glutamyl-gamma-aminobutyrate hydrolase family protein [Phenylobacterium sp.]|uniref:glutamine amidotransferase-related protein n=1 Tax=Phenylobacterium sp. TaxID=1871053 RepID=UPI0025EFA1F3|nr:gamma-glutamyl-gamma-aminobutyrate hydrolase family protein [Phenylobacterium sp.]MCA6292035.1 gamma-glutamyl-gamma-aminobutyrate hydrolase family protein [Phenylobacterium sp.]MCA6313206.1 gamma-glutamyl-gamma-aminobutyrate hydrolase family protein [Phenylobacterium sp.]MCA6325881.1 gamma-glutamyl-gamma-aminobutyrate hydrolase family protein [Phenylobacterium sp.]
MRLAILETGAPPDDLVGRYGDYPAMFRRLLLGEGDSAETFDVTAGRLPADPSAFDACLVTGSSAGVYDPLPWIAPLKAFLTAASGRTALVGVCFGHQVMAEAFGGRVIKSPKGWGVGLHRYETRPGGWLSDLPALAVAASHQDQVVEPPQDARVVAASDFTPFGALHYPKRRAISIQLHPEFEPAYARALIEARRGTRYTDEQADAATASYAGPSDRLEVGRRLRRFIETGAG